MISISVKGLTELQSKLASLPEKLKSQTDAILQDAAAVGVAGMKRDAPVDVGFLRGAITFFKVAPLLYEFVAQKSYAAYLEFGTVSKVSIPAGLEEFASQYRGSGGNFDMMLANLREWCKRHGIPESAAYPIAVKILKVGIAPRPYFFPNIQLAISQARRDLEKINLN